MMPHAQHGLIGPAGMIAVPTVTVELSQEAENVLMERKVIARDQLQMNNNAIDNHVTVLGLFTGKVHMGMLMAGALLTINIYPPLDRAQPTWIDVWHIVFHIQAAMPFCQHYHMALTNVVTSLVRNQR